MPRASGLYFIVSEVRQILYIGATVNLKTRWACHDHRRAAEGQDALVYWMLESDPVERKKLEASLIYSLLPVWNKKGLPSISDRQQIGACVAPRIKAAIKTLAIRERRSESQIIEMLLEESPKIKTRMKLNGNNHRRSQ